jgi:hypothetical protein
MNLSKAFAGELMNAKDVKRKNHMGISAKEYQKRLAPILKLSAIQELVQEELVKSETILKDLKENEFLRGERPDGSPIGRYRSPAYSMFKQRMNPLASGDVDLILTGKFINSFFVLKTPTKDGRLFGARDSKRTSLVEKYGSDIMGLNQQVFTKFEKDIIIPRFVYKIKNRFRIG